MGGKGSRIESQDESGVLGYCRLQLVTKRKNPTASLLGRAFLPPPA